ncbi:MAG TPA: glutamate--tRNA ligase [Acidimicrobiales bacterium]|nr:glutamate--tRNA ligase [Acidimicrobiales bacterium]
MGAPRVRIAPSPTGYFHVGTARTALFNWLFARRTGGTFILRIEDTDQERNRDEWSAGIVSAMEWLDLTADEGPSFQSQLAPDHAAAADALWAGGYLYACDCTRAAIDERAAARGVPGYDGFCRDRGLAREGLALRFRVPEGETVVHDLIRGDVTFAHDAYEDFVAVKSNGFALYPLANLVDDRSAAITHVIRGEDLLPTTPKQIMMWEALNASPGVAPVELPLYAHLPMLVNEQRKKRSKRRDAVAVELYRDAGYLPEAFVNYLALLGWSPRGGEVATREAMIAQFDLAEVSHSSAFFDVAKLTHLNGEYLRALPVDDFVARCAPWVAPGEGWRPAGEGPPWASAEFDEGLFARVAPLAQTRVATLSEVPALVAFLFQRDLAVDEAAFDTAITNSAHGRDILAACEEALARMGPTDWEAAALHDAVARIAEGFSTSLSKAQAPLRVAVTGSRVGLPLFESLAALGRERTLERVGAARDRVGA